MKQAKDIMPLFESLTAVPPLTSAPAETVKPQSRRIHVNDTAAVAQSKQQNFNLWVRLQGLRLPDNGFDDDALWEMYDHTDAVKEAAS